VCVQGHVLHVRKDQVSIVLVSLCCKETHFSSSPSCLDCVITLPSHDFSLDDDHPNGMLAMSCKEKERNG